MPSSNHLRFVLPRQIVSGFCHEATQLYANKFILSNTCTYSNIINLRFISRKVLEQFNLWHSRSNKNPDHSHEIVNDWRGKCSFHFLWFLLHSNSDKSGIHLNSGGSAIIQNYFQKGQKLSGIQSISHMDIHKNFWSL